MCGLLISWSIANPLMNLAREMFLGRVAELPVAHDPVENFTVAFHPLDEEIVKNTLKSSTNSRLTASVARCWALWMRPLRSASQSAWPCGG